MTLAWRIVQARHVRVAFDGEGAARFGGRWNSRGVRVVYASSTVALAALETLVHMNPLDAGSFRLIGIEFDEELVERCGSLPRDWRNEPPSAETQRIGDDWVQRGEFPVLAVPSAIVPQELNYLLNPAHPDFRRIKIGKPVEFGFDTRLLG